MQRREFTERRIRHTVRNPSLTTADTTVPNLEISGANSQKLTYIPSCLIMDQPRPCGCKGKRTCLICEEQYGLNHDDDADIQSHRTLDNNIPERLASCSLAVNTESLTRAHFAVPKERLLQEVEDMQNESKADSPTTRRYRPRNFSPSEAVNVTKNTDSDCDDVPLITHGSTMDSPETVSEVEEVVSDKKCQDQNLHVTNQLSKPAHSKGRSCSRRGKRSPNITDNVQTYSSNGRGTYKTHAMRAVGLQTDPLFHLKNGRERIGDSGCSVDCVCIDSGSDLGMSALSSNSFSSLNQFRNIKVWARKWPHKETLYDSHRRASISGSGIEIDVTSVPQEYECEYNCIPCTAAGHYETMQSRSGKPARGMAIRPSTRAARVPAIKPSRAPAVRQARGTAVRPAPKPATRPAVCPVTRSTKEVSQEPSSGPTWEPVRGKAKSMERRDHMTWAPSGGRKLRRANLRSWQDPHQLYPDPLRWGGERPYQWEENLRVMQTNTCSAYHPQRWVSVGKHQYTNPRQYPRWPDAITCRLLPSNHYDCAPLPICTSPATLSCLPNCRTMRYSPLELSSFLCETHKEKAYVFCPLCNKAWPGWDMNLYRLHPNHSGEPINYPGIYIEMDWLSEEEEKHLIQGMDEMPWDASQSGRRKQNFGPKCNFKKMKMKAGDFKGFPGVTQFVQERFRKVPILEGYCTIEQCSLEYDPSTGASIDPHIDDCWIWGERIVTVNLLSDTVLTMTPYHGEEWRYNLLEVAKYEPVLNENGAVVNDQIKALEGNNCLKETMEQNEKRTTSLEVPLKDIVVRVPMPRRSLLVIFGSPRYNWEHRVLRDDVKGRRLCLAYREFTPPYLPGGNRANEGSAILKLAQNFWDHKAAKDVV